ncbi:MAG: cholesterol oxidase substrate-binding domain-containing protein [Rhodococcus sp. (in: high G+C Gram-positive bacteria)]|uniref:cholesterol oxidase substrate-binding domain-containing protein n=1 Tax=Rhodococcus sp. TaxID=1831 RepID=UPI002AD63F33|nr:cholesterol oxidase substrate-binding domain-containing protein [Rhodococcus sp. (in: high G+C Gram-positive bacteria)]
MRSLDRRTFLTGSAAAAAGLLLFAGFETPAHADEVLTGYPGSIPLRRARFENWDGAIVADQLWTAVPRNATDVVALVNWAHSAGYTIRPQGYRHTWSPLTVAPGTAGNKKVLLVDTTSKLTAMSMADAETVRVQAGASMEKLLRFIESNGRSLTAAPAPGDVTVGGVLAVGGHGTAIPSLDELGKPGTIWGSMSNLVSSLTAVVWDAKSGSYVERTFDRTDTDCAAFLTHLGRAFITEVTLKTVPAYMLRCQNFTNIPISELFAKPDKVTNRSLSKLIDASGRVGVIWYAFTDKPWVQVWTRSANKPFTSRRTLGPFNYLFADNLPTPVPQLLGNLVEGHAEVAPAFNAAVALATSTGLDVTFARDMWGPASHFLHFVKPTTLRVTAGSHVIVTRRSEVQAVVHEFTSHYTAMLDDYRRRGMFPINSGVEIRVTGVDSAMEYGPNADAPALSAATAVPGHPEWDTAIWLDTLTLPDTPHQSEFYRELERTYFVEFPAERGVVRAEWAKRWGHTNDGAWLDTDTLRTRIPASYPKWDSAVETLARWDPHRIFTTELLDQLMP